MNKAKVTFGLLVTTRGFFNPLLAKEGRSQLIKKLDELGHKVICLGEGDTNYGCVETYDDAVKCANLFKSKRDEIDGIIISAPNFGDESSTVNAIRLADLGVPVLVHAFDDNLDKLDLDNRRDSFCGKLSICSNLYQYAIPFTVTKVHTCSPDSEAFEKDIEFFNSVCSVVRGLRNIRIAQFGARPAAFQTVRYSEKLLQRSGITCIPIDLSEVLAAAKNYSDKDRIEEKIQQIRAYGAVPAYIPQESIERSAKLTLAVENLLEVNQCQAGAFQCWDSLQNNFGCASCLTMSMIGETGKPIACETDVAGAVTMLALSCASGKPSGYFDWNNNYGDDRDKCILIHCANYPKSFFASDFEISNLDILGASLGYDKCFGACKGRVAAGDVTYARISTDDFAGKIKCYVGEGRLTNDPIDTKGGPAVVQVPELQKLMHYICNNGFEHHVAMNRALVSDALEEALGKYLGWDVYAHRCQTNKSEIVLC